MKQGLIIFTAILAAFLVADLLAQSNALNTPVKLDASGYLIATANAYTGPDGPARSLANTQVKLDSNGYLLVTYNGPQTFNGAITANPFKSSGSGMAVANVGANSCGTTAATIAGNSNAFVITSGSVAVTQCRVAFPTAATTEWDCAANDETTVVALRTSPVDSTHTDIIGSAIVAGDLITGICFPR